MNAAYLRPKGMYVRHGTKRGRVPRMHRTSENAVTAKFAQRLAPGIRQIGATAWESYGRLLLHQLLDGHAVCPGDLGHGRHVGSSLAGLQLDEGPLRYVGKLRRLLGGKTPLLPKDPQLHRDRSRHHYPS